MVKAAHIYCMSDVLFIFSLFIFMSRELSMCGHELSKAKAKQDKWWAASEILHCYSIVMLHPAVQTWYF